MKLFLSNLIQRPAQATSGPVAPPPVVPTITVTQPVGGSIITMTASVPVSFTVTDIETGTIMGNPVIGLYNILLSIDGASSFPIVLQNNYNITTSGVKKAGPFDLRLYEGVVEAMIRVQCISNPDFFGDSGMFEIAGMA